MQPQTSMVAIRKEQRIPCAILLDHANELHHRLPEILFSSSTFNNSSKNFPPSSAVFLLHRRTYCFSSRQLLCPCFCFLPSLSFRLSSDYPSSAENGFSLLSKDRRKAVADAGGEGAKWACVGSRKQELLGSMNGDPWHVRRRTGNWANEARNWAKFE